MKKILIASVSVLLLISCNSSNKFKISGKVTSANGKTIFLEHTGLVSTDLIDSAKINSNGEFSFKAPRPEYPDFYRLTLEGKTIAFAVDSCDEIEIETNLDNFASDYKITGTESNVDIRNLRLSLLKIQRKLNAISVEMTTDVRTGRLKEIEADIKLHKEVAKKIILKNPRSTAAYFAIYQKINNTFLFSPYNKEDKPYFGAVATAYNAYMPNYDRTKNLYNITLDAINTERQQRANESWNKIVDEVATGYIDIELPDKTGKIARLSDLEGKLVLIDFSAYDMEQSVQYTFALRDLYNKYHSKGLEIYQVSLDRNKIQWENSTENIPWICVRDENGPNTVCVGNYNVTSIPTSFLLSRKGTLIGRNSDFEALEKEIRDNL